MLDKQYNRIIRWVHRAQTMSADGNYSDAILDVECARAELDDARQELLQCHRSGGETRRLPFALLAVSAAAVSVLVWASPLGLGDYVARGNAIVPAPASATAAAELPAGIREAAARSFADETAESEKIRRFPRVASSRPARRLNDDVLYRLTEVGRKALQKNTSGIVLEFD